jgi:hypothetical protein
MPYRDPFEGFSIFDDKGEVKRLVDSLIQNKDPGVIIESLRKINHSYILTFSKKFRTCEVELTRTEIEASWDWRNGNIDDMLQRKVFEAIAEL